MLLINWLIKHMRNRRIAKDRYWDFIFNSGSMLYFVNKHTANATTPKTRLYH